MAEYGKIYKKIWNNERFRVLPESAKLLFIYLCSNQHCNLLGLYGLHKGYIMGDLGFSLQKTNSAVKRLEEETLILYNQQANLLYVQSWFEHNPLTSSRQTKKALAELSEIPQNAICMQQLRVSLKVRESEFHKTVLTEIDKWFERNPENGSNSVSVSVSVTEAVTVSEAVTEAEAILSETSSDHQEAINYFTDKYLKEIGMKYDFKGGKDGSLIKGLLRTFSLDELKLIIDRLFQTNDSFIASQAGRTIGVLSACSNKLVQEIKNVSLMDFSPAAQETIRNFAGVLNEN